MGRYSDSERDEVFAESRRLLDEADAERAGFGQDAEADSEFRGSPDWIEQMLGPGDPLEKWRRGQLEAEAARAAYRQREAADTNERRSRDWQRWATAIIERELEERDKLWVEAVGGAIAEIRHQLRGEFAQALAAYASKGDATVAELRKEIAVAKGFGTGTVIDISPEPVVRKTKDNAA